MIKIDTFNTDEFGNNLFWADRDHGTIEVISLSTKSRAIIHHFMGEALPIALAVIPEEG